MMRVVCSALARVLALNMAGGWCRRAALAAQHMLGADVSTAVAIVRHDWEEMALHTLCNA